MTGGLPLCSFKSLVRNRQPRRLEGMIVAVRFEPLRAVQVPCAIEAGLSRAASGVLPITVGKCLQAAPACSLP
jgi:hypothetical protein